MVAVLTFSVAEAIIKANMIEEKRLRREEAFGLCKREDPPG